MKHQYTIALIISSIFYSCNITEYENNDNPIKTASTNPQIKLIKTGEIKFELDSLTAHLYNASQFIEEKNCYSFLSNTNEIIYYNYNSKTIVSKTPIKTDSPCSYEYINEDSIIIANYKTNSIYIINQEGNILNEISIRKDIKYYPFPMTKIAPIINSNNNIYLFGNICGEYEDENKDNRKIVSIINKSSGTTVSKVAYPDIYEKNWGGALFRWVYADYNPIDNMIILSFPADHYIYTTDLSLNTINAYYAGSSFINATEYIKKTKSADLTSDERSKHFVETNSYSRIVHDKYNNVYYRICELKSKYKNIPIWEKELVIIILDHQFKIIGETYIGSLPSQYRESIFITKEGLHLPQKNIDENKLMFNIYKLSKK